MRSYLILIAIISLLALPAIAAEPPAPNPAAYDPFGYTEDQFSSWGLVNAAYPYQGRHGCYPMGNGICFAHLGVSEDFNTLRGIVGPGYQTHTPGGETEWWAEGEYPDITVELRDGEGQAVPWTSQSIQVLRGAAIVRTKLSGPRGSLWCLSYANPDYPAIERHFEFEPADGKLDRGLRLYVNPVAGAWDEHGGLSAPAGKRMSPWMYEEHEDEAGRSWSPGTSDPRSGATRWSMALSFIHDGELPDLSFVGDPYRSRLLVAKHWHYWSANTRHFDTGNLKLDDLMLQLPVIIETQRDSASGGVAPMVSYHGYWVRDTTGPLLCYLENGRFDEVRRMLSYHRKASWKLGACRMSVPLDVDVGDVREPVWRSADDSSASGSFKNLADESSALRSWSSIAVEHAEVPSLIVLQHYWYWQARREAGLPDDGFIAEAWPYLKRNLFGMAFDPAYGVKFHGDETYAHGALYSTFDNDTTEDGAAPGSGQPLGYPNGYIPTDFFNRDNTMLHREAAKALAEMAGELGMSDDAAQATELRQQFDTILANYHGPAISDVTHQQWTYPFANIDTSALPLDGPASTTEIWSPDDARDSRVFFWMSNVHGSTLDSNFVTGHSASGWLTLFLKHPMSGDASTCLAELMDRAWPDAAWCEVYEAGDIEEMMDPLMPPEPYKSRHQERFKLALTVSNPIWPYKHGAFSVQFAKGQPVSIYGRVNRIRPWESGVNYAVLSKHLPELIELGKRIPPTHEQQDAHRPFARFQRVFPRNTELLVLTRDNHYKDVIGSDFRLATIPASDTTAWDIGLPITIDDLRHALLWEEGDVEYIVPFLYLDRDVKLSDRRTFKTAAFWDSPEMQQLLADYKAAGGILLEEADLRPAWELTAELWSNRGSKGKEGSPPPLGIHLRVEGPPGSYNCKLDYEPDHLTLQRMLASSGVLPSPDGFHAELELEPGVNKYISLDEALWTSLIWTTGRATVEYTSPEGKQSSHTQILRPNRSLASRIEHSADELPMELPVAHFMSPKLDGVHQPWDGRTPSEWPIYPSLGLLTSDAVVLSGSFAPGGGDSGLSLSFGYDTQYLYIAGTVIDDQIVPGGLWQGERINFVFDARLDSTKAAYPEGSVDKAKWQADDFWIALAPFCTDQGGEPRPLVQRIGGAAPLAAGGDWDEAQRGFYGQLKGARCAVRQHPDGGGYVFELALPLADLPYLDPRPGRCCGFGVFISDMDASDTEDAGAQTQDPRPPALAEAMWLTDWRAPGGGINWNFWDCGLLYFAR